LKEKKKDGGRPVPGRGRGKGPRKGGGKCPTKKGGVEPGKNFPGFQQRGTEKKRSAA